MKVYLHGMPGSPSELACVGAHPTPAAVFAPDRTGAGDGVSFAEYTMALAKRISDAAGGDSVHLIGFSLGAHMALQLADRLGGQVARIDLVSPAAPLELGDFLPEMAGRAVFASARDHPLRFSALTGVQGAIARLAPAALFRLVFANAAGADAELARQAAFRSGMVRVLKESFRLDAAGYRREIEAYVKPWTDLLPRIAAPVRLWHGEEDNWAPIAMSERLAGVLPNVEAFHAMPGLSHYSTLRAALPLIL